MQKNFTLLQTIATAAVFGWYGFMFGWESARKELNDLVENLRRSNSDSSFPPPPPPPPQSYFPDRRNWNMDLILEALYVFTGKLFWSRTNFR
ncbi:hypothetical protein ACH5RR_040385 [Cinchona calisaya]|uniref:Uncharacterized protein n=1 Tax=Cinchona calisaya TaxID=153742 RepID=A0ABD2XSA0_9GENT